MQWIINIHLIQTLKTKTNIFSSRTNLHNYHLNLIWIGIYLNQIITGIFIQIICVAFALHFHSTSIIHTQISIIYLYLNPLFKLQSFIQTSCITCLFLFIKCHTSLVCYLHFNFKILLKYHAWFICFSHSNFIWSFVLL